MPEGIRLPEDSVTDDEMDFYCFLVGCLTLMGITFLGLGLYLFYAGVIAINDGDDVGYLLILTGMLLQVFPFLAFMLVKRTLRVADYFKSRQGTTVYRRSDMRGMVSRRGI